MWFGVCLIALIVSLTLFGLAQRDHYFMLRIDTNGAVKDRIVRLPLRHLTNQKLRREVKIFNRMCLVLPTVHRVAVVYIEQLRALLKDPHYRPPLDPYARLFYAYACDVLATKTHNEIIQRQLRNNLRFLLAPRCKIVRKMKVVWLPNFDQLNAMPIYKIFNDTYCNPAQPEFQLNFPYQTIVCGSYIKYQTAQFTIKRFAHFYELKAINEQTLTINVGKDKNDYDCTISRGTVTVKHIGTGAVRTYTFRGDKIRLATSVCAKTDALQIYLVWSGTATISLNRGRRELLTTVEIEDNRRVEQIVDMAYRAKYVVGEKLRSRYQAAEKYVPTLRNLTQVVVLSQPADFFSVWDNLTSYQRAARLFGNFNLVFIYAATNQMVADLVAGFITAEQVQKCQQDHLLLFFLDRTTCDPDALYFLIKMTKTPRYPMLAPDLPELRVSKTYPYVKTLTLTNPQAQATQQVIQWPLKFHVPTVVTINGQFLTAVSLGSGRVTTYQLPAPLHWTGEWLTTHLNIPLKVKLMGYETRQFSLTRDDVEHPTRLRKKDLITALEEIQVKTGDSKLDAVFAKPVVDGENPELLQLVKAADRNVDKKLLITVLEDKHEITTDVWQYLMTKLIGIRVANQKIHLVPAINLLGEFSLSFTCRGEKYHFSTRKNLPTNQKFVTISHGQKIERNKNRS